VVRHALFLSMVRLGEDNKTIRNGRAIWMAYRRGSQINNEMSSSCPPRPGLLPRVVDAFKSHFFHRGDGLWLRIVVGRGGLSPSTATTKSP